MSLSLCTIELYHLAKAEVEDFSLGSGAFLDWKIKLKISRTFGFVTASVKAWKLGEKESGPKFFLSKFAIRDMSDLVAFRSTLNGFKVSWCTAASDSDETIDLTL